MNILNRLAMGALIILGPVSAESAIAVTPSINAKNQTGSVYNNQPLFQAPYGYFFMERNEFADFNTRPLNLLAEARKEFQNHNESLAAKEIYGAAQFMKIQAEGSPNRDHLMKTATRLENLSTKISNREVKSNAMLDRDLSQSARVEAEHHFAHATEVWLKHMASNVGADLSAAADAVEKSADWSGRKISRNETKTMDETKVLSKKLEYGGKWSAGEVGKGLTAFGHEMSQLPNKMEPDSREMK